MRRLWVLLLALPGGCATNSAWFKSGVSLQEGSRDLYECATESPMETSTRGGAVYLGHGVAVGRSRTRNVVDSRFHGACMQIRGYQWTPVPEKWPRWWIVGDSEERLIVATAPWCPAGSSIEQCSQQAAQRATAKESDRAAVGPMPKTGLEDRHGVKNEPAE